MAQTKSTKKSKPTPQQNEKSRLDIDTILSRAVGVFIFVLVIASVVSQLIGKAPRFEFDWISGLWIVFGIPAIFLTMMLPTFPLKERPARRKLALSLWFAFFSVVVLYIVVHR